MQIKHKKNRCEARRGIFRCESQHGHISERHKCGPLGWFTCRECGRNHSVHDHARLEEMVKKSTLGKNGSLPLAKG